MAPGFVAVMAPPCSRRNGATGNAILGFAYLLARALRGQRADTGEQLRRPGANGIVNSHDLTMGVPKSMSELWAQSTPECRTAIEQATRKAAEQTVRYVALTTACVQRRTETGEACVGERAWRRGCVLCASHRAAGASSGCARSTPARALRRGGRRARGPDGRLVTPNQAAWVRSGRATLRAGVMVRASRVERSPFWCRSDCRFAARRLGMARMVDNNK